MNTYKTYLLKQSLIGIINNSNLSLGEVYFILKDVFNLIEREYEKQVKIEYETYTTEQQETLEFPVNNKGE